LLLVGTAVGAIVCVEFIVSAFFNLVGFEFVSYGAEDR
jgi:hypothetical protein